MGLILNLWPSITKTAKTSFDGSLFAAVAAVVVVVVVVVVVAAVWPLTILNSSNMANKESNPT